MNTLCIILLVSLTGYVRIGAVNEPCGEPSTDCEGSDLYCEGSKCKIKAGKACTADSTDECIMGANCDNSVCNCGANYTANADMTMCLVNIGGGCDESSECVQGSPKVLCTEKKCACSAMYAPNDMMSMCMIKAGMACTSGSTDECIMGATCVDSKCECGANHTASADMTMCLKNIEQACTAADTCVPGATCVDSMCKCGADHTASTDMTKCNGSAAVVASFFLLVAAFVTSRLMFTRDQ